MPILSARVRSVLTIMPAIMGRRRAFVWSGQVDPQGSVEKVWTRQCPAIRLSSPVISCSTPKSSVRRGSVSPW